MSNVIGHATLNVLPSTKGFGSSLKGQVIGPSASAGKAGGKSILSGMAAPLGKLAIMVGGAVAGFAGLKAVIGGGIARQLQIEQAQAKLTGLGHTTEGVTAIMSDALKAVDGTAFGLGEAATVAASAVAAGIAPGADLERTLRLVGDAATIAGTDMGSMGAIFNKVAASNKVQMDVINQLHDRGVPALQLLANELGVTAEEASKMASSGKIDFATFQRAMEEGLGGAALKSGETTAGALANMRAAFSRLGEVLTGPVFQNAKHFFNLIRVGTNVLTDLLRPAMTALGVSMESSVGAPLQAATEKLNALRGALKDSEGNLLSYGELWGQIGARMSAWISGGGLQGVFDSLAASREQFFGAMLIAAPGLIQGLVTAGVQMVVFLVNDLMPMLATAIGEVAVNLATAFRVIVPQLADAFASNVPFLAAAVAVALSTLVEAVAPVLPIIVSAVVGIIPGIAEALLAAAPSLLSAGLVAFQSLLTAVVTIIPTLVSTFATLLPQIVMAIVSMLPSILSAGLTAFQGLVESITAVLPTLLTSLVGMVPPIISTVIAMLPSLLQAGLTLFAGLVTAVTETAPQLITTVLDMLPGLLETVLGMLPSLLEAGLTLFLGLVTAVLNAAPSIIHAVIGYLPQFVSTIVAMIPTLLTTGVQLFVTLAKAVIQALPEILGAILFEVIPALVGAVIGAVPQLLQAGIDLIGGLVSGLWQAAGTVASALLDIIGGAVDGFLGFLGIKSPSRLFMGYGRNIGEGMSIGIDAMADTVEGSVMGLADAAAGAMAAVSPRMSLGVDTEGVRLADESLSGIGRGAHFSTTYNDYSTSTEDKRTKLSRAQTDLERKVEAGGSLWRK